MAALSTAEDWVVWQWGTLAALEREIDEPVADVVDCRGCGVIIHGVMIRDGVVAVRAEVCLGDGVFAFRVGGAD